MCNIKQYLKTINDNPKVIKYKPVLLVLGSFLAILLITLLITCFKIKKAFLFTQYICISIAGLTTASGLLTWKRQSEYTNVIELKRELLKNALEYKRNMLDTAIFLEAVNCNIKKPNFKTVLSESTGKEDFVEFLKNNPNFLKRLEHLKHELNKSSDILSANLHISDTLDLDNKSLKTMYDECEKFSCYLLCYDSFTEYTSYDEDKIHRIIEGMSYYSYDKVNKVCNELLTRIKILE